jgi:glycosyltransferase involved in cell wall biosynthesis
MRILIVAPPGEEEIGGVASVVKNLARFLQNRGHDVSFFRSGKSTFARTNTTKWGSPCFELNLQVPFGERPVLISLLLFAVRFPFVICQLIRTIRKKKIEIVNIHYPTDPLAYFALCRRILPISLVTSVHGADLFPSGRPKHKYSKLMRFLLSSSDRIVAPSQACRNDVGAIFPFLKNRLAFIHNGIDIEEMQVSCGNALPEPRTPYLLCIAMHNEKKGLDVLLRAFALIQDPMPSLKLVLVGDGPLRGELESLASSLGIRERVEFLGLRGRDQVPKLIHGCEAFVLPSRSEPFGIAIVEALACKKPVVSTTVGGIPEIIKNGKNGILVEPDNPAALATALVDVLQNRRLQLSIASNGFLTVCREFGSKKTGATYETLFSTLARSRMRKTAIFRGKAGQISPVSHS